MKYELNIWDSEKAGQRWSELFEMTSEERASSVSEEQIDSDLGILEQNNATEEQVVFELASLDLVFGQVRDPYPMCSVVLFEPYARFFLVAFADCKVEDGKLPSPKLIFHPIFYEKLLRIVTEDLIRDVVTRVWLTESHFLGMRDIFAPIKISSDQASKDQLVNALISFWKSIEICFRDTNAADAGRGNVVIVDTLDRQLDNPLFKKRALEHAGILRQLK